MATTSGGDDTPTDEPAGDAVATAPATEAPEPDPAEPTPDATEPQAEEPPAEEPPAEAPGRGVTAEVADSLRIGMSVEEVAALIGEEPSSTSQSDVMGTTTEVRMWMAGLGNAITASFTNGELTGYVVTGVTWISIEL